MFRALTLSAFALAALPAAALPASAAEVELWRLDCGRINVPDLNAFSDTFAYGGQSRVLTNGCYLIRHDDAYLLWDAGVPLATLGQPFAAEGPSPTLDRSLTDQLAQIGVAPEAIGLLGISHYHFDHVGQASAFPAATLLIGAADLEALRGEPPFGAAPELLAPWLDGGRPVTPVTGDLDVFGDGTATILSAPGHTPGETALLVRLKETGPVLLSGDVVHFEAQIARRGVPGFNADRADSLASLDRLTGIAEELDATLVIQHEPDHVSRLPAFPASAR
jgi:N-acyl homoserine lactone hydrolase